MTSALTPTDKKPLRPIDERCQLCGLPSHLTFHHLVPKEMHDKASIRARFSLTALRHQGIWICRLCHTFLHDQFDERTLATRLNTLESLKAEPVVVRHLDWASRQRRRV